MIDIIFNTTFHNTFLVRHDIYQQLLRRRRNFYRKQKKTLIKAEKNIHYRILRFFQPVINQDNIMHNHRSDWWIEENEKNSAQTVRLVLCANKSWRKHLEQFRVDILFVLFSGYFLSYRIRISGKRHINYKLLSCFQKACWKKIMCDAKLSYVSTFKKIVSTISNKNLASHIKHGPISSKQYSFHA